MARKTQGVYELVEDVIETIHEPYGEDITLDVCLKIQRNPHWLRRYKELDDAEVKRRSAAMKLT